MKDTFIDYSVLQEIRSLPLPSGNALVECVDAFLQSCRSNFAELDGCLQNADYVGAYGKAHAMKGACANLGLNGMRNLFKEIEEAAKKEAGDVALPLFDRAKAAYDEVTPILQEEREKAAKG